jgi:dTDP-4-dehydrorhamnose 3,5-epimerase
MSSEAGIPGVSWGHLTAHEDERGAFREVWRASAFKGLPRFVQANLSTSEAGVLRALHYHRKQVDHWIVVAGRVFVALVDLRPVKADAKAEPRVQTRRLTVDDTVTIPTYVAHGFLALEPTQLLYLVTNEYDGADELGVAWNDPEIAVPWPVQDVRGELVLSTRDRANPPLASLRARI